MVSHKSVTSHVSWCKHSHPHITDIAAEDGSIVVLPVASIEQHGHHMPTGTDSILVESVVYEGTENVADEIPVLVLPPIWSGFSPHHLSYGGTVTIEEETLIRLIEDVVNSAIQSGFDSVVLVNGHGGNKSIISSAVSTIGKENELVKVIGLSYFDLAKEFIEDLRESETGGFSHGGEFETSLMLYLYEELVDESEMPSEYYSDPLGLATQDLLDSGIVSVYRDTKFYSDSGAVGDPEMASVEKGEAIFEGLVEEFGSLLREIHS
jgi:creatinine amidohydrolase